MLRETLFLTFLFMHVAQNFPIQDDMDSSTNLMELFKRFDKERDITRTRLEVAQNLPIQADMDSSTNLMELFKRLDKDRNGDITRTELETFARVLAEGTEMDKVRARKNLGALKFPIQDEMHSSIELMKLFKKFDTDGNGRIEKAELEAFLSFLVQGTKMDKVGVKEYLLQTYDENRDAKISLTEMSKILPVKENMVHRIANKNKDDKYSAADIIQILCFYDQDNNGKLDGSELDGFLKDVMDLNVDDVTPQRVEDMQDGLLETYDTDHDGEINLAELSKFLPKKGNMLLQFRSKDELSDMDFQQIFSFYDSDNNGQIEDGSKELDGFVHDFIEMTTTKTVTMDDIQTYKGHIMILADTNNDGKINKAELTVLLRLT